MTNEELKQALVLGHPVVADLKTHGAVAYERVTAIIYRFERGRITVSAELFDRAKNSVTIAAAKDIREMTSADGLL